MSRFCVVMRRITGPPAVTVTLLAPAGMKVMV